MISDHNTSKQDLFYSNVRRREREKLRKNAIPVLDRLLKFFSWSTYRKRYLNSRALIIFSLFVQMPLHHIVFLMKFANIFGALGTVFVYVALVLLCSMPLVMLNLLMGNYCRYGYIRFWQCISLFKGVGVTILFMLIIPEFINAAMAGLSLLYIVDVFGSKLPWTDCSFKGASSNCIPMYGPYPVLQNCSLDDLNAVASTSTQDYFMFNKVAEDGPPYYQTEYLGKIKSDRAIATTFVWILVFFFMLIGFQGFQKIMLILNYFALISLTIIFAVTLSPNKSYESTTNIVATSRTFQLDFWIALLFAASERAEPGTIIYLTSITDTIMPHLYALKIYGLKVFLDLIFILWMQVLTHSIYHQYHIKDSSCLYFSCYDIAFTMVPDVLSRIPLARIFIILWFLCLFIWGYSTVLYTFTATVDSLIDAYPHLGIYRSALCITVCIIAIFTSLLFSTPISFNLFDHWLYCGQIILQMITLVIVAFAIVFLYSITQLAIDYYFAYGEQIHKFWIQTWKCIPFLLLFTMAFLMSYFFGEDQTLSRTVTSQPLTILSIVFALSLLLPIFIVIIWKYGKNVKYQTLYTIIHSDPEWGYYDVSRRIARRNFKPHLEVRYKMRRLKCKHQCLVNSKKLKKLQLQYNYKRMQMFSLNDDLDELKLN